MGYSHIVKLGGEQLGSRSAMLKAQELKTRLQKLGKDSKKKKKKKKKKKDKSKKRSKSSRKKKRSRHRSRHSDSSET